MTSSMVTRGGAIVNPRDRYIHRQIPYVILNDTPSPSSSSDSDPSEASSAASLAVPQARKTTWLPPRHQLAPRDVPGSTHEVGESSRQAEMRVQLRQVTLDMQSTRLELRQSYGSLQETRTTLTETRVAHQTLVEQFEILEAGTRAWRTIIEDRMRQTMMHVMMVVFWQYVEAVRGRAVRVREMVAGVRMLSLEARLLGMAIVLATIAIVIACLPYFIRIMAPKRGQPFKKATKNVTNPEQNQVPSVNVELNPDSQINSEANVVPPENIETNNVPPLNPEVNQVPPAGASGSELNEAMIARIVREQLSACGVLTQHQPHITAGSGGDHDHTEHNATGGHIETHNTTGAAITKTTVPNPPQRGCTYKYFASCNPPTFTGKEGAAGLIRWIEEMETKLKISQCLVEHKVSYAAFSLKESALTRWNTQAKTLGSATVD
ncbi:hypothetical protein E3N88_25573 [Mikania micrantha]|uniref:Retrotransposon gag domain-containing protein n=1 Tax=Mikania micrantha TaxID=192012 RepID=A0A5N6N541_9ASTR|nr:hypothetical protein E3N88_25573 [Mikania micrantha]